MDAGVDARYGILAIMRCTLALQRRVEGGIDVVTKLEWEGVVAEVREAIVHDRSADDL